MQTTNYYKNMESYGGVSDSAQVVASTLGSAAVHYGPLGEETGYPAILLSQSGRQGRVVYFAPPLGNRYQEFGVSAHRELIAVAVRCGLQEKNPQLGWKTPRRRLRYRRMCRRWASEM